MQITRRAALKGGAAVAAVAAPLAVIPFRATAEDAEVFTLIEEHGCAVRLIKAAEGRWYEAFTEALPPHLRAVGFRDTSDKDRALFNEVLERPSIHALYAETRHLEHGRKVVVERLAETPASTLAGIHAKLQDAIRVGQRGRYLDDEIALSAADDLARLVGEG